MNKWLMDLNCSGVTIELQNTKAAGRMITIDPSDPDWEDKLSDRLNQSPR